jgi:signal transduction histidine kinase
MNAAAARLAAAGPPRPPRIPAAVGYGVAAVAAALAGAIAAAGGEPANTEVALARTLIVGAPLLVGLHAWYTQQAARFGAILIATGVASFFAAFAESDHGGWYVVGRTAGWSIEVLFVYAALAFPHGRLRHRSDRVVVGAMALVVASLYLPQLFLAEQLQVPSPYTSCREGCPANVLFALESEPASVVGVLRSAGALCVFTIGVAVVALLWRRVDGAPSITRRLLQPVAIVVGGRAALMGVAIVARQAAPDAAVIEVAAWALALATPALALVFGFTLVRFELLAGQVLQRLVEDVRTARDGIELQRALARGLGDSTLQLAFPRHGSLDQWSDAGGRPFALPGRDSGRWVVAVADEDAVIAAIVCHEDLRLHPTLVESAAKLAAVSLDNSQLAADATASLHELEASRARLATSAERERRRIERNLHDGAQQRLVALRIEMELVEDLLLRDPAAGRARLHQLEGDVDDALEELRALAHGVYPPVLADHGLPEALRAVAARSPVRTEVDVREVGRYLPELESAVYFCVLEALQNALKHAKGVRRIVVELDDAGPSQLRFVVRDDGIGMPPGEFPPEGAGIINMRDRLAAFGGDLTIASAAGVGTTVRGFVVTSPDRPTR